VFVFISVFFKETNIYLELDFEISLPFLLALRPSSPGVHRRPTAAEVKATVRTMAKGLSSSAQPHQHPHQHAQQQCVDPNSIGYMNLMVPIVVFFFVCAMYEYF